MNGITPRQRMAVKKALELKVPFALYAQPGEREFSFYASARPGLTWNRCHGPLFLLGEFAGKPGKTATIPCDYNADEFLALDAVPPQPRCLVQTQKADTDILDYKASIYAVVNELRNRIAGKESPGKVVISRVISATSVGIDSILDVADEYFKRLKSTFRYVAYHHTTGLWIGATPEVVMDYDPKTGMLHTEALAGTLHPCDDEWDTKNRREHNMVKDYILQILSEHKVRISGGKSHLLTVEKPFGRLRHLCTSITAIVKPQAIIPILSDLAPTPAVGGFPREYATVSILTHELHMRRCYGGCVGVVSANQELNIYANLRCALAVYDAEENAWSYNIYAGGGITADSDPDAEWRESEAKAAPLRRAIEKVNTPNNGEDKKD